MQTGRVEAIGLRRPLLAAAHLVAAAALIAAPCFPTAAAEPAKTKILICKDASGKPLVTDPSDPRCYKPPPNESERVAAEETRRKQIEVYNACKAEQRSLQSLLSRYPTKDKHDGARRAALLQVESSMAASQKRMERLLEDRKKLLDEAEFYPNKPLPTKLKSSLEANEVTLKAKRDLVEKQQSEVMRITNNYDVELARLRKLWAGAPPGSLGPLPGTQQVAAMPAPGPAGLTAGTPAAVKTTAK